MYNDPSRKSHFVCASRTHISSRSRKSSLSSNSLIFSSSSSKEDVSWPSSSIERKQCSEIAMCVVLKRKRRRMGQLGGILRRCRRRAHLLRQPRSKLICLLRPGPRSIPEKKKPSWWRTAQSTLSSFVHLATLGEKGLATDLLCRGLGDILAQGRAPGRTGGNRDSTALVPSEK